MEHEDKYTVTIRGSEFQLTKAQIEFDGPNHFTTCFSGNFKESQTRHLKLSRDPDLFLIICDYLSGYKVLPLSDQVIPARMSPELALANLKIDAAFYQLDGLVEQCAALTTRPNQNTGEKRYLILGCEYKHSSRGRFESQIDEAVKGPTWSTPVTEAGLSQKPFDEMERPEDHIGYDGLRTVSAIGSFARAVRGVEPQLVGWHIETTSLSFMLSSRLMVVLVV
ncbi:unnamed protein product [Rhizoctonia solani]|uniref:BTB domain-containing protein n=1 Tax=Rhizoctonia solani TaxID=456999 RepID=A0A8H3D159_9AGAM|nr:unnamed protein product [Rhizoctonia solani]